MSQAIEEFEVVVVGAGPGGLAAAVTLGTYGVRTLLVERRESPSPLPRANTASTGTMELLRRWGLEKKARERAIDVEMQPLSLPTMAAASEGVTVEAGFPTRDQAALVSPTAPTNLGQDELEPLLEGHLASLPGVRVERRVELTALEDEGRGGFALTLTGPDGGHRRVRTRFLVGADGMNSAVRSGLGITRDGTETIDEHLTIHFRAPLWDVVGERRHTIYFLTASAANEIFLPVGRPDRWAYGVNWDEGADLDALTSDQMVAWIREAAGTPDLPVEIGHASVFGYGTGLARQFRKGNAFLIGDAAHRVTPRGATGLNTAIRDGFDIGWKLGWSIRGWGGEELLNSYERERRPVAEFNTERSTRWDGSILGNQTGINADVGGRIAHVWLARGDALVSTLDLLGDSLTLFTGPDWQGSLPAHPAGPAVNVERLDAISSRALGLTPVGAVLVRPDGHPVALWNDGDADPERLARAVAAAGSLNRKELV